MPVDYGDVSSSSVGDVKVLAHYFEAVVLLLLSVEQFPTFAPLRAIITVHVPLLVVVVVLAVPLLPST